MTTTPDEFFLRTEDIPANSLVRLFVETKRDREIIEKIKARVPVVLVGSRGVGKSFLLRVAERELSDAFSDDRVLPVYTTFNKSALLLTNDPAQFQHYMLARICSRLLRNLTKLGLASGATHSISILAGGARDPDPTARMEAISHSYEASFQNPGATVDRTGLPTVDQLRDAIEDLCEELNVSRIVLLMDEAAHIFQPEQQRQFFTLFRDLRSPQLSCNAAVYPGVTSYGEIFQPAHDAAFARVDRDPLDSEYVAQMRDIVERQAPVGLLTDLARNGQNFAVLAYAASGNPRLLLKTVARAGRLSAIQVNEVIKQFYRTDLWAEHSGLPDKYPGHLPLIDWGRKFIETVVLPEIQRRNIQALSEESGETTCFFWIHRDAPAVVKEALRLLEYTGIVHEHTRGIRATRSEIGTRYAVNLGCIFALESAPRDTGFQIAKALGARRFVEFGANHQAYTDLVDAVPALVDPNPGDVLERQLQRPLEVLDISEWQRSLLRDAGMNCIRDLLSADEAGLQQIRHVGPIRSRRIINEAMSAVLEYVSG